MTEQLPEPFSDEIEDSLMDFEEAEDEIEKHEMLYDFSGRYWETILGERSEELLGRMVDECLIRESDAQQLWELSKTIEENQSHIKN